MNRARGFSLVELMVSVVVGLLALMFATRLVINGEQNKQSSLGGSDSMQNGMLALFSISGDAAQAGWGLNDPLIAGCNPSLATAAAMSWPRRPAPGWPVPSARWRRRSSSRMAPIRTA